MKNRAFESVPADPRNPLKKRGRPNATLYSHLAVNLRTGGGPHRAMRRFGRPYLLTPSAVPERPRQDSNLRHRLRRPVLYPLSYGGGVLQEQGTIVLATC